MPFILVGTKIHNRRDTGVQILDKRGSKEIERKSSVTFNNGLKMASDIKAQGFFECSAKTRVSKSGLRPKKTFLWHFGPGPVTPVRHKAGLAWLYYLRIWLEARKFGFRKLSDCTIFVVKIKALISIMVTGKLIMAFVFAYAKDRFSS